MYRAVGLLAMQDGLEPPFDEGAINEGPRVDGATPNRGRGCGSRGTKIIVDGHDVGEEIRSPECSLMASAVSALAEVREALVPLQRELGMCEGRSYGRA